MSETPFQFRHHGQLAGPRVVDAPAIAAPRRRGARWGWFGVVFMGVAAALLWWVGRKFPAEEAPFEAEISPSIAVVPEPVVEPESVSRDATPPVIQVLPVALPQIEVQPQAPRARSHAGEAPALRSVAQLSLVRVSGVAQAQVPGLRRQVGRQLEALRACSEGVIQKRSSAGGTIIARVTVRRGQIAEVVVDSASHDSELRWCFRKRLMGLLLVDAPVAVEFGARLEFFLLQRTVRERSG